MAKQILNAVPEVLYETAIPVYTYHFVVVPSVASNNCPGCGFVGGAHWQYCPTEHARIRAEHEKDAVK